MNPGGRSAIARTPPYRFRQDSVPRRKIRSDQGDDPKEPLQENRQNSEMNPHALLAVAVRLILRELADGSNKLPLGIEVLLLF
jgi:hypothetical protein